MQNKKCKHFISLNVTVTLWHGEELGYYGYKC